MDPARSKILTSVGLQIVQVRNGHCSAAVGLANRYSLFFNPPHEFRHDLEDYFESLAPQGFQKTYFQCWHEKMGVSAPIGGANLPSRGQPHLTWRYNG